MKYDAISVSDEQILAMKDGLHHGVIPSGFLIVQGEHGDILLAYSGTDERVPAGYRCSAFARVDLAGVYYPIKPEPIHFVEWLRAREEE